MTSRNEARKALDETGFPVGPTKNLAVLGRDPRRSSTDRPHSCSLWTMSEPIGTSRDLPNFVPRT
jgi:hypothetical protein